MKIPNAPVEEGLSIAICHWHFRLRRLNCRGENPQVSERDDHHEQERKLTTVLHAYLVASPKQYDERTAAGWDIPREPSLPTVTSFLVCDAEAILLGCLDPQESE